MSSRIEDLKRRREEAFQAGGEERIAKIHEAGKLIARERLDLAPADAVEALRDDLRGWPGGDRVRRGVVVHLASAERGRELPEAWLDPEADPFALLLTAPPDLSRSILYALAALAEGVPFVNFTPAPAPSPGGRAGRRRARRGRPAARRCAPGRRRAALP